MLISSKSPIWWCAHICLFLKKPLHPLHSTPPLHLLIQNILLAVNPFHCFFVKSLWVRKKFLKSNKQIYLKGWITTYSKNALIYFNKENEIKFEWLEMKMLIRVRFLMVCFFFHITHTNLMEFFPGPQWVVDHFCATYGFLKYFDTKIIYTSIYICGLSRELRKVLYR